MYHEKDNLITILTIMIVLVGAVFADPEAKGDAAGTATINITATIGAEYPRFQILASAISTASGTISGSKAVVGTPGAVTIDTNELLTKAAVITFTVNQIKDSRATVGYSLKIKANDLILAGTTRGEEATDEHFTVSKTAGFTATGTVANVITVTEKSSTDDGFTSYDGGFDVQYLNNKYIAATDADPKEIGTVQYTWAANNTAKVGTYNATVTMEVVAQ